MESSEGFPFKAGGCAGMTGPLYEIRLALIFMIKALLKNFESFQLGCNLPDDLVGKLDDVVFFYRPKNDTSDQYGLFVQAKNTSGNGISLDSLKSEGRRADFSLVKYFKSYKIVKAQQQFINTKVQCVLLTKQPLKNKDELNDLVVEQVDYEFPLWQHGNMYKLKHAETINKFQTSIEDRSEFQSFLGTFIMAVGQPDEAELTDLIKIELGKVIPFDVNNLDNVYNQLERNIQTWYTKAGHKNCITKDQFLEWLITASGQVRQLINPWRNAENQSKWSQLKHETQTYLLQKHVTFQGKEVHLSVVATSADLEQIENNTENLSIVTELLHEDLRVGSELTQCVGYEPKYYVERTVQYVTLKDPTNLEPNLLQYTKQHSDGSFYPNGNIQDRSVIKRLRHHIDKDKVAQLWKSEKDFLRKEHRVVIITDKPGMGKSTILTNFHHKLKEIHPEWWIITIDLNNAALDKFNLEQLDVSDLVKMANVSRQFETILFEYRIKFKGGVVFMLDGFDEITEERQKAVIKLAKLLLKQFKVNQLIITSRPHHKKTLENELGDFAFTLAPFSRRDQVTFLVQFWSDHVINDPGLKRIAKELIQKLSESIGDRKKVLAGIPLQCRMLAEAYLDPEANQIDIPNQLDLISLYEHFVDRKVEIYEKDKKRLRMATLQTKQRAKDILDWHKLRALKLIFPDSPIQWENEIHTSSTSSNELKCFGLVFGPDDSFIHQTFAEFFAALSLTEMFQKGRHLDFFIEPVCSEKRLFVLRQFINSLLKTATPIWTEELNYDTIEKSLLTCVKEQCDNIASALVKLVKEQFVSKRFQPNRLLEDVDSRRRNMFHNAAKKQSDEIMKTLLDLADELGISAQIFQKQDENGKTVLHFAARNQNEKMAKMLVSLADEFPPEVSANLYCKQDDDEKTALHFAARNKNDEIAKILLDSGRKLGILAEVIKIKDKDKQTVLHTAGETDNEKVMFTLLDLVKELHMSSDLFQIQDGQRRTVLHIAVENENEKIVKMLLHDIKVPVDHLSIQDEDGRTVFHMAAEDENEKILKLLLHHAKQDQSSVRNVFKLNRKNQTVLHIAAESGNEQIMKILLDSAKELRISTDLLLQQDKDGQTVLHLSAGNANEEIMEMLLDSTKGAGMSAEFFCKSNRRQQTVFHIAAADGNEEIMEMLLGTANEIRISRDVLDKMDQDGKTALQVAIENEDSDLVNILLDFIEQVSISAGDDQIEDK